MKLPSFKLPLRLRKGFTLIELLVVIAVIGVLATLIISWVQRAQLRAKNSAIVSMVTNLHSAIDLSKYPGSLEELCFDFEAGNEFEAVRKGVENNGGIWHCDSTVTDYRVYVKLNQEVVLSFETLTQRAFAQEGSDIHTFGNYYCVNSNFEKNFTHWPGDNLVYPSCSDGDYIPTPEDPEPTPEPTPDPDPESDPEPPLEHGGSACNSPKEIVCHFGKSLCISSNAVKAHVNHGDEEGPCS